MRLLLGVTVMLSHCPKEETSSVAGEQDQSAYI